MKTISILLAAATALLPGASALAMSAEEFDKAPIPGKCTEQSAALSQLLVQRDRGLPLDAALQISAQHAGGELLPAQTIREMYEYPWVGDGGHFGYFLWTCKAKSLGMQVLPLPMGARDLQACFKKAVDDPCGRNIRNHVLGFD
jgi:hypothetical protein